MVDYAQYLDGIVHEPSQREGRGFDLTVSEVYEVTDPGQVDFGGGELELAGTGAVPGEKRDPDDDYEWWDLDAGHYLLAYNESLTTEDVTVTLQTRDELLACGAFHPTLHLTDIPRVPLAVGGGGLELKENARVSTLVDVDTA